MAQDTFIDSIQGFVMDGIRWLSDKLFGLFQGGGPRGAVAAWFAGNWITLLVVLIVAGLVVDWVVWILRWRHYKLWFGARQEILPDEPPQRLRKRKPPNKREHPARETLPAYDDSGFEEIGFEDDMDFESVWADSAGADEFGPYHTEPKRANPPPARKRPKKRRRV